LLRNELKKELHNNDLEIKKKALFKTWLRSFKEKNMIKAPLFPLLSKCVVKICISIKKVPSLIRIMYIEENTSAFRQR
jgi:hypothetical protein